MFGAFQWGEPYWGQGPESVYVVPTLVPVVVVAGAYEPTTRLDGAAYRITVEGVTYAFAVQAAHEPRATADAHQGTQAIDGAVED